MCIYLDWAATAVPDAEICKKILDCSTSFYGNPSSLHQMGQKANALLKKARERCAKAMGVNENEIFFTSGGTESNNIVLLSLLRKPSRGSVLVSAIEHPAVYEPANVLAEAGYKVKFIKPAADGIIKPATLAKALTPDTKLVAIMSVNNETGAIQPINELAANVDEFAKKEGRKIHFHCDAVQAAGKIKLDFADPNVHSFAISGHKLSGPRGTGILVLKNTIMPMVRGGEQENGIRPGTENTAGIYGMSLALEKAITELDANYVHASSLMKILLEKSEGCTIIPECRKNNSAEYSPYILSMAVMPIPAEVMARTLDDRGICLGTGSACSNRKKGQSRTLSAMGVSDDVSFSRIRISTGCTTTEEEILEFIKVLDEEKRKLWTKSM